jgi:uncharacterized membrane protein
MTTESKAQERVVLDDYERWYSAIGYLFFLCFFSLYKAKESDFIRFHARQAFLLFLAECAAFLVIIILDKTLGRLPILGFLIIVLTQIAVYLAALFLSVMGFVKALFGERWTLPFLGNYSDRVPLI